MSRLRVSGFRVQTRLVNVLVSEYPDDAICLTDPINCCPDTDSDSSSSGGSSSGGSGSSSGGGGSVPNCTTCPDTSLPATIIASFTGATGSCTCLNGGTITLNRSGSPGSYTWSGGGSVCGNGSGMTLACNVGQWFFSGATTFGSCPLLPGGPVCYLTSGTCSPFYFVFATAPCCLFCSAADASCTFTIILTA